MPLSAKRSSFLLARSKNTSMPSSQSWISHTPKTSIAGFAPCSFISAVSHNSCQHYLTCRDCPIGRHTVRCEDVAMTPDIRVLIVDDQLPFRQASRMVVELTDGFELAGEATNGAEAIELAERLRPDLVLMDVQMPGIDGIETTRRIRAFENPPIVIVMSTHESGDYEAVAEAAGAIGFVPKSQFGMDTLAEMWNLAQRS